jgi:hypothetical protein
VTSDGFPTAAEVRRLEAEADSLLRQDAEEQGFIKDNGRGFSAYARSVGITTKKTLETTYKHELAVSLIPYGGEFSMEEKLDALASGMDKIGD